MASAVSLAATVERGVSSLYAHAQLTLDRLNGREMMEVPPFFYGAFHGIAHHTAFLVASVVFSFVAYRVCMRCIPAARLVLMERNIFGVDINKTTAAQRAMFAMLRSRGDLLHHATFRKLVVPESLGIVAGAVYLCVAMTEMLLCRMPLHLFNGAVTTVTVMLLIGFVDDILDLRWRHKLVLSFFGSIPLLMNYDGSLSVMVPRPLLPYFPSPMIHLGSLYLVYLLLLSVFCTNSINILAGVNGVEVGQSLVIAVASVIHNILQLRTAEDAAHQLSAILLLCPFIAVSLALWKFNRYPSSVFVGDSYTYFSGTVLLAASVSGVYTKTLMLFFIPQIVNFLVSLPQLFHLVSCPRHRVPTWIPERNVLTNSRNYTILNLILWVAGDMSERQLTRTMLYVQAGCCFIGFILRYWCAGWVYDVVV